MTEATVRVLLLKASAAYPNQVELTKEMIAVWVERLATMDAREALDNLNRHIDTNRFFPTIADIIKHDPEVFTDYAALQEETKHRLAMLETRVKLSPEALERIKRQAESGELAEKFKDDPWLGGASN